MTEEKDIEKTSVSIIDNPVEKPVYEKREKIKNFLKNKENLYLLGLVSIIIIVRLYYFILTKNQPLWWDESEYLSYAKNFAGIIDFKGNWGYRLPGFPLLASLFFMVGINSDATLRFFLAFIPSLIVLFLTYFLISEMYKDKKIAILSTLILTFLWEHLFYSNRFHTENLALIFQFLSIFIFFKVYLKGKDFYFIKKKYSFLWIFLCLIITIFFRPGNLIFIPSLVLFFIIINQSKIFTKKNVPYVAFSIILLIALFIIFINLPKKGILVAFHSEYPIAWNVINILAGSDVFTGFYKPLSPGIPAFFLYAFILGIIFFIIDSFLFPERFKKIKKNDEDLDLKSDIFNILILLSVLLFFILIIRPPNFEYRWFFPLLPGLLVFTSKGIISSSEYIGHFFNFKTISILLIIIITVIGLYTQMVHSDFIIRNKLNTYLQVKESGLWIKENSLPSDIIISSSIMQHSYYAERKVYTFNFDPSITNESELENLFNQKIKEIRPKYIVISMFEPGQKWIYEWPQKHNDTVVPVQAYYLDPQKSQLALVIYMFK